uniref:Uncharacterized protein n=1 Tax=Plectus sambesii TaxID=2011161 RepID=A0A914V711_9BILA
MSKIVLLLLIAPAFSSAPGPFRGLIDSIKLKGSPPGIFDSFLSLSNDAAKKARANLATIPPTTTTTTTTVRPPSPKPQKPVTEHPLKAKKPPSPGTAKDDVHEMMNLNIIQAMEDFSKLSGMTWMSVGLHDLQ